MKLLLPALTAVTLIGLAACSQAPREPYADAYQNALGRYPGTSPVTPAMTDRFVRFFSHDGAGDDTPDPADLYGEPLYFSDTLITTENREQAVAHLRRMHSGTEQITVSVMDTQIDGADVYLVWHMHATFKPLTRAVQSRTVGVTHLRFGPDERIIFQQDFWDSAEGLYRHLPLLGFLIDTVQERFNHHAP